MSSITMKANTKRNLFDENIVNHFEIFFIS